MRILTVLSGVDVPENKLPMSHFRLSEHVVAFAKRRLKLAAVLQFTLPGVPCVYYADEAGMEGGIDPFNRICYPWGNEDKDLVSWYSKLAKIRKHHSCFRDGEYKLIEARKGLFAFTRGEGADRVLTAVNVSDGERDVYAPGFDYDLLRDKEVRSLTIKAGEAGIFTSKT